MSKVLEKVVARRLANHMCTNNLYDPLQSAYGSQHSTETAILKIHNDIIEGLDAGKCTVLSSLNLSAAFDTVDHTICIRRLNYLYGIDGSVLQWFESFTMTSLKVWMLANALSSAHLISLLSLIPWIIQCVYAG